MVKTTYSCETCDRSFESYSEAEACELRGTPTPPPRGLDNSPNEDGTPKSGRCRSDIYLGNPKIGEPPDETIPAFARMCEALRKIGVEPLVYGRDWTETQPATASAPAPPTAPSTTVTDEGDSTT